MTYTMTHLNAHKTSLTLAGTLALVSVITSVCRGILLLLGNNVHTSFNFLFTISGSGILYNSLMLVITPLLTFVMTYLAILVFCCLFNVVAKYTGGVSVCLSAVDKS
ncbi:hypothetical protein HHX48_02150 [Salinimonas sp. HHU 13199]|uniref:DUF3566 domain-containing protein n=1 Tax=Salinimonas profundi TaxID=2729140 RepID=A0ABR8LH46_9ALTE|nr:hypothetical protein [Salinimonas profundi]MBD3584533.1 hypothetical protein [Salinimonas profundi]